MRTKRRPSTKLLELKGKAKREGWLRWLRTGPGEEADERALLAGCWFDPWRGEHAVNFIDQYCTLTEGAFAGRPFLLRDWQHASCMRVFGWQKLAPEWGYPVRRFKFWWEEVPKKNGKTPFAASIANYLLIGDSHGRQINVTFAATTRKQAERCLKHSIRMTQQHEELQSICVVRKLEGFLSLAYGDNEANVVAADPDSADGINGHCIADEIHRWKGMEFFNTLRWMLAAQPEGLFVAITTAGSDPDSIGKSLHDYTIGVNSGRIKDDAWFGEIFAADTDDDPDDESTWLKANPSLGTDAGAPLKLSAFREDHRSAKQDPAQWPAFLQLRLNRWRSSESEWLPLEIWDAGEVVRRGTKKKKRIDCFERFDLKDLAGQVCDIGFDGAAVRDTTCAVLSFPAIEDDVELVRILPYFWLPRARAEELQARVPFAVWEKAGHIKLTDGDAVDFDTIFADLLELLGQVQSRRLYFDPLFQAEWLTQKLEEETGLERVAFPQTFVGFSPAVKQFEQWVYTQGIRHNGHPLFTWQFAHTKMKTDSNQNKRPVKQKHGDYRTIDGIVAALMGTCRPWEEAVTSFYDDDDAEVEFL